MPVHNAIPYLDEAITSILSQSFGDFEFVVLDDGSTDGSLDRLRYWAERDRRIRLIRGRTRSGPVESSNRVVRESRAALVARMDADDRAHPDRLKLQIEAFAEHPDAVLMEQTRDQLLSRPFQQLAWRERVKQGAGACPSVVISLVAGTLLQHQAGGGVPVRGQQ